MGLLRLSPGDAVALSQRAAEPLAALGSARPAAVAAGGTTTLALVGAPEGSRLALRLDPRRTLWAGRSVVSLRRPGSHAWRGLAVAPDGRAGAVQVGLPVRPRRALASCAVRDADRAGAFGGGPWLWLGLILLKRRRRRRSGNRLGRSRR
jgi:hypothetical protein